MKEIKILKTCLTIALGTAIVLFFLLLVLSWLGKYPEFLESRKNSIREDEKYHRNICMNPAVNGSLSKQSINLCEKAAYQKDSSPYFLALIDVSNSMCSENTFCKEITGVLLSNIKFTIVSCILIFMFLIYTGVIRVSSSQERAKYERYSLPSKSQDRTNVCAYGKNDKHPSFHLD